MNKLKIAIASFLLVNSFAFADTITDYQSKAVKELYNKGILQTIVKEEDFSKKENFSRGEIAGIIYNTLTLKNAETIKNASQEDIVLLKSLISDFSSELAKLGAKDYELLEMIESQNKNLNDRIDKEVATLNKKIDKVTISGDPTLVKEIYTAGSDKELMSDLKGEGRVNLNLNISEDVTAKVGYDLENETGIYDLKIKKNNTTLSVFNDETMNDDDWADWTSNTDSDGNLRRTKEDREAIANKKLPEFDNAFGIVSKAAINNKDTIVMERTYAKADLLALVTSTDEDDIYGIQFKKKMPYFMSGKGSDANMYISYVGLDDKATTTDDRNFLILGTDFTFPISDKAKQTFVYNYSKMYQSTQDATPTGTSYSFPIVDDEANFVYSKTEIDSKKVGKTNVIFGAVNTGANFDASELADSQKELFKETETEDLIKLDSNIFGAIAMVKNQKGNFENSISSINYKKNDDSYQDETTRIDTLYRVNSKLKLGIGVGQNTETDDDDSSIIYKRDFTEGRIELSNIFGKNTTNLIKIRQGKEDNYNKDEFIAYFDNKVKVDRKNFTLASQYEESAEEHTLKTALTLEKTGKISDKYDASMLIGGRYDKDFDIIDTNEAESFRIFTKETIKISDKISLEGGLRFGKNEDENNGYTYAASVIYKVDEHIKISGTFGPIDVVSDYSSDIFEYNTDGIYGDDEQNIGTLKITCTF